MATYQLDYAQENLPELFREARAGEDVLIVRGDGTCCQLLPTAEIPQEIPTRSVFSIADDAFEGGLVPA